MSTIDTARALVVERYRDQIGRARHEVTSPALLLDLDVARRNIATMADKFADLPAKLRPHIKVHKSVELSRMTVEAGAVGVACATPWEAMVMARGGIADVLIANQVVQRDKVAVVAELAREHRITVTVDDVGNVAQLSAAAGEAGSELQVLIELDVGMGRCGVREITDLIPIAERIAELPHLRLRGLQAYEGHCMLEPDRDTRLRDAGAANALAVAGADLLAEHGHPCADISGGGTGTYFITGANPRITEVQAGSYALMDCFHGNLVPGGFEVAMTVLGTVISRQGHTVVLDCGRKAVGIDFVTPPLVAYPEAEVRYYAEEHCLADFPGPPPLHLGDTAEVMGGYGPTTVNLHDVFHVIEGGVVTDIWPVNPRGSGPPLF
ncbi:MAG TPA: alanine racemase [Solirubrobacteraceae bacterium]|nr:alanine racemase [Solirubrobacteraceae bacterium]